MHKRSFHLIVKKILRSMAELGSVGRIRMELGEDREKIAARILSELEREGFIKGFVPTGNRSYTDVKKGVDFFVVKIIGGKYRAIPLSITGDRYSERHEKRHPEIPVGTIGFKEDNLNIRRKIKKAVLQYAHN